VALGTVVVLEVFARLSYPIPIPGAVLFGAVLYTAYRSGLAAGLVAATIGSAYHAYRVVYSPLTSPALDDTALRIMMAVIIMFGVAVAVGHLHDRFNALFEREREARATAEDARERSHRILESIADGFVAIDHDWRLTYVNHIAEDLLHHPRAELLGKDIRGIIPNFMGSPFYESYKEGLEKRVPVKFEAASLLANGWMDVQVYPSSDGITVYFRDCTERRIHEEKLHSMSMLDELTGIYNRRGFFKLAEQQCSLAERNGRNLLLIFADLDDLKQINDRHGHTAGDQALCEVAGVLRNTLRDSDIIARIGGDEFAALALETEVKSAPILLERLFSRLEERNSQAALSFRLSLSVGTSTFLAEAPCTVEELLTRADEEMYRHKRKED
jgi:diguanylate cyclase (GGDEF)-like protein/PAS domain S-box-containing protein